MNLKNLFQNKKQKVAWIVYLILGVLLWDGVTSANYDNKYCKLKGYGCINPFTSILILTLFFVIIAFILADKKEA